MNINDTKLDQQIPLLWPEIVAAIFARQRELMVKYKEIEQLPAPPVSLHTAGGQRVIKDFAWRTVEELTESYEAWEKHDDDGVATQHALEELADSVHFFVELLIFAGITPEQCCKKRPIMESLPVRNNPLDEWYWAFTYRLGLAMNFLRNKAWKQSQVPTDEGRFREALLVAWEALIDIWCMLGCTQEDVFTFYFKKSNVNVFRQRSNY